MNIENLTTDRLRLQVEKLHIEHIKLCQDNFLYFVNHWSTKIVSWSWCKLYSNRKTGYGYRKRK